MFHTVQLILIFSIFLFMNVITCYWAAGVSTPVLTPPKKAGISGIPQCTTPSPDYSQTPAVTPHLKGSQTDYRPLTITLWDRTRLVQNVNVLMKICRIRPLNTEQLTHQQTQVKGRFLNPSLKFHIIYRQLRQTRRVSTEKRVPALPYS